MPPSAISHNAPKWGGYFPQTKTLSPRFMEGPPYLSNTDLKLLSPLPNPITEISDNQFLFQLSFSAAYYAVYGPVNSSVSQKAKFD
jgi:hypothetical protein